MQTEAQNVENVSIEIKSTDVGRAEPGPDSSQILREEYKYMKKYNTQKPSWMTAATEFWLSVVLIAVGSVSVVEQRGSAYGVYVSITLIAHGSLALLICGHRFLVSPRMASSSSRKLPYEWSCLQLAKIVSAPLVIQAVLFFWILILVFFLTLLVMTVFGLFFALVLSAFFKLLGTFGVKNTFEDGPEKMKKFIKFFLVFLKKWIFWLPAMLVTRVYRPLTIRFISDSTVKYFEDKAGDTVKCGGDTDKAGGSQDPAEAQP